MTGRLTDAQIARAKARPVLEVARALGIDWLRRAGLEHVGPCPVCGGHEKRDADRFSINPALGVYNCRKCASGGDGIALARFVRGDDFAAAVTWIAGDETLAPRARPHAAAPSPAPDDGYRRRSIADARAIWARAHGLPVDLARAYLAGRGITFPAGWPPALRCLPDHPYRRGGLVAWRGPALVAGIQDAKGRIVAVHQTWFDAARPGEKARICDRDGALLPAKLVRGAKKGGAIRLTAPSPTGLMVMGEGIETTASALVAGVAPAATFWAGVDLGNMSGRTRAGAADQPDLSDADAFVPPAWVRELVFIQDGDSDPDATAARLRAGLRRAAHHVDGLTVSIMQAPRGLDLNDVLRGASRS